MPPSHHASDAPDRLIELVERAKAELVAAVPSPRGVPGRPLAEAVLAFEQCLRDASGLVAAAGHQGDAESRSARAVREALGRAERLRLEAPPLDYEGLVAAIADLLDALDDVAEVAEDRAGKRQSTRRRWPDSSSGTS